MDPLPPPLAPPIPFLQHTTSRPNFEVDRNHKFPETIKLIDEPQPLRGGDEDYDLISGWARNLSVSPRLYPTSFSTNNDSSTFGGGYKVLGDASPLLGPRRLSVGTGLSPLLGPTVTTGMTSMVGGGYDYSYSGNGGSYRSSLHLSPPSNPTTLGSINHSFSNLTDRIISSPPAMNLHSSVPLSSKNLMLHSGSAQGKQEMLPPPIPTPKIAKRLSLSTSTDAVQLFPSVATDSMIGSDIFKTEAGTGEEDPRIKAYAKLEFPNFDIYIQKLSVIVGRRPAPVVAVAASPSLVGADGSVGEEAKEEVVEVKLEDFMMGLEDDAPVLPTAEELGVLQESMSGIVMDGLGLLKEGLAETVKVEEAIDNPTPAVILSVTPSSPIANPVLETDKATAASVLELIDLLKSASPSLLDSTSDVKPIIPSLESINKPSTSHLLTSANLQAISISPTMPTIDLPTPIITDIDLGPIRAVSRQHARLYFDYDLGSWAIEVLGRNGVVVEGTWKAKGEKEKLGRRTKIQIAERIFFFVLPTIDEPTSNDPYGLGPMMDSSDDDGEGVGVDDDSSSLSEVTDSDLELSPLLNAQNADDDEDDDLFSSELSAASVSPLPLSNIALPDLPPLPLASSSTMMLPFIKVEMGVPGLPTVPIESGRGRRNSSNNQRMNYYDGIDGGEDAIASTSSIRPTFVFNGSSGKNLKTVEAVRAGGKGKSTIAKVKKSVGKGKGKMKLNTEGNYGEKPIKVLKSGGKGKGKGGKLGKSPYYIKKAKKFSSNVFYSDEEEEEQEFYDDEEDDIMEEEAYPEEEMYEYALAVKKESGEVGKLGEIVPKIRMTVAAKKAPRKPASPKKVAIPLVDMNPYLLSPLIPLPPLPSLSLSPVHALASLPPLPALPIPSINLVVPKLSSPKSSMSPAEPPRASTSFSSVSPVILPSPDRRPPMDPYALPTGEGELGDEDNSKNYLPDMGERPPPERGVTGKRGRGRPPKNGICAQRPRKYKVKSDVLPGGVVPKTESAPTKVKTSTKPSPISPYTLPHFPGDAAANSTLNITTFTPTVYAEGETPPSAAPVDDRLAKPPFTYASLIAQAIMSKESKKLTLNGIYDWITFAWPYFSENQNGWQNSIRHNLTISRGFLKVLRTAAEPGKGAFWMIDPAQARNFDGFNFRKKTIKAIPGTTGSTVSTAAPMKASLPRPPQMKQAVPRPGPSRPFQKPGPSLSKPLPILIAPIPASYVRPPPPPSSQPPDELTLTLLRDPPIVLHEGKLILNPTIFATLGDAKLKELAGRPAKEALEVLQAFVVGHFKAKMKENQLAKMKNAEAEGTTGVSAAAAIVPTPTVVPATLPATIVTTPGMAIDPKLGNENASPPVEPIPVLAVVVKAAPKATKVTKGTTTKKTSKRKAEMEDDSDNDFNPKSKK